MKQYLTVSEMAELFGLGIQTLHFYDRIGLFSPVKRDPKDGTRKYKYDQTYQLAFIKYFGKMGYSLDDIRELLNTRNPESTITLLKERSEILNSQLKILLRTNEAILRKIEYIRQKLEKMDPESIAVRRFPKRHYIPIGSEEQIYMEDSFYFYPTIAFYESGLKYFGAYIDAGPDGIVKEDAGTDPSEVSVIPGGRFLVGYHRGPYEKIEKSFERIRDAFPDLKTDDQIATFNIIDQFVEQDSRKFITEIQMRIRAER